MAGFLGFGNYSKPGPGVSKDEPQKNSFFMFFEILFRKFWKLIEINLLFFVCCIPFCIPFFLVTFFTNNYILYCLSFIPFAGISMIIPGMTYVLRNFSRQEHAFLWMDFKDTIKNNWRQALIVGIIDLVVIFLATFSLRFYFHNIPTNGLFVVPFALSVLFTVIFTFMNYYLYVMLITFDLTIKQIFKNAFIFAFAGMGHNILITLFGGIVVFVSYAFFPISLMFVPFISFSLLGLIIVFNVWPVIKKYMIPETAEETASDGDASIFEDSGKE